MKALRRSRAGKKKINISIYVDEELLDRMSRLGIRNKSQFINDILSEKLDELEEIVDNEQDLQALRQILRYPYRAALELLRA